MEVDRHTVVLYSRGHTNEDTQVVSAEGISEEECRRKCDMVKIMKQKNDLYGSILCEFKLDKITFVKAMEYEAMAVESQHG